MPKGGGRSTVLCANPSVYLNVYIIKRKHRFRKNGYDLTRIWNFEVWNLECKGPYKSNTRACGIYEEDECYWNKEKGPMLWDYTWWISTPLLGCISYWKGKGFGVAFLIYKDCISQIKGWNSVNERLMTAQVFDVKAELKESW